MSGSTGIVYLIKHHVYLFVPYILSTNFLEAEPNLPRSDYLYVLTTKAPTLPKTLYLLAGQSGSGGLQTKPRETKFIPTWPQRWIRHQSDC